MLSLNQCNLGEDGAAYIAQGLAKNRRLRTLLLSSNQLGDRGLQMIADSIEYSSLEHLDLSKNQLTNVGVVDFAENLSNNRSLVSVNLRSNQIGKDGGMAMREAVGIHKYLVRVYLEDNAVQVRDIEEIEKYTARNRESRAKQRMPHFE